MWAINRLTREKASFEAFRARIRVFARASGNYFVLRHLSSYYDWIGFNFLDLIHVIVGLFTHFRDWVTRLIITNNVCFTLRVAWIYCSYLYLGFLSHLRKSFLFFFNLIIYSFAIKDVRWAKLFRIVFLHVKRIVVKIKVIIWHHQVLVIINK